jgi:hypothetical protein
MLPHGAVPHGGVPVGIDAAGGESHAECGDMSKAAPIYGGLFVLRAPDGEDIKNQFPAAEYIILTDK